MAMISIENLNKTYEVGGGHLVHAVHEVNLKLQEGSFTVIVGNNGSGKSTFINLICGTERPDLGNIYIDGEKVNKKEDYQRAHLIGRMFQNPSLGTAGDLTILENLRLAILTDKRRGLSIGTGAEFRKNIQAQLERLQMNLESQIDQPVKHLSGGQRQAISLLMALIHQPKLLLLDEPTAALDPKSAKEIIALANSFIRERQITAVLITHNMQEACKYGDRLLQLERGKIKRDLSGDEKSKLTPLDLLMWFKVSPAE